MHIWAQSLVTLRHAATAIKSTEQQADVAQLVEQPIRNRQVTGSSPVVGSSESFSLAHNIFLNQA